MTVENKILRITSSNPVDTGRKLSVHKTFRGRPGRLLNVLCTFNLRSVSTGNTSIKIILDKTIVKHLSEQLLKFAYVSA